MIQKVLQIWAVANKNADMYLNWYFHINHTIFLSKAPGYSISGLLTFSRAFIFISERYDVILMKARIRKHGSLAINQENKWQKCEAIITYQGFSSKMHVISFIAGGFDV